MRLRPDVTYRAHAPLFSWGQNDAAKRHASFFAALKIDRPWQFFMAVESAAGDAWDFFIVDDGVAILHCGDHSTDQCDVIALPFSGPSWLLRLGGQKAIDATHVMARGLLDRVGFYLHFVAAAQIDAAVRILSAIEFKVQLEVFEFRVVDQLRAIPRRDQLSVLHFPYLFWVWLAHMPSGEVLSIEQLDWRSPFWRVSAGQRRRSLARPMPRIAVRPIHRARQNLARQSSLKNHVGLRAFFLLRRNKREAAV